MIFSSILRYIPLVCRLVPTGCAPEALEAETVLAVQLAEHIIAESLPPFYYIITPQNHSPVCLRRQAPTPITILPLCSPSDAPSPIQSEIRLAEDINKFGLFFSSVFSSSSNGLLPSSSFSSGSVTYASHNRSWLEVTELDLVLSSEFYQAQGLKIKFDFGLTRAEVPHDLESLPTWTLLDVKRLELISERSLVERSVIIHNPVIGIVKFLESVEGVELCPPTYETQLPETYPRQAKGTQTIGILSHRQRIWSRRDLRVPINVHREGSSQHPIDLVFVFHGILVILASFLAAGQSCLDNYRLNEGHSTPVADSHRSPTPVSIGVWRQYPQLEIYAPFPAPLFVQISRGYPHFDIYPVLAPAAAAVDEAFKDREMGTDKHVEETLKSVKVSVWSQYPHLEIYGPRIPPIITNIAGGYPDFVIYPSCMETSIPTSIDSDEQVLEESDKPTREIPVLIWQGYPNFIIYPPHAAPVSVKIGRGYPQFDIYPVLAPAADAVDAAFKDGGMTTYKKVKEPLKGVKVSVWSQYPHLEIYGPRISSIIVDIGRGYPDYAIYPVIENSITTSGNSDEGSLENSDTPVDEIPVLIWQGYPNFVI
ncbi:hypothetical protein FRC02_009430, partial [Tulasnella sp. 418]